MHLLHVLKNIYVNSEHIYVYYLKTSMKNWKKIFKFISFRCFNYTPSWTEDTNFFNYKEVNWFICTSCVTLIIKQYMQHHAIYAGFIYTKKKKNNTKGKLEWSALSGDLFTRDFTRSITQHDASPGSYLDSAEGN